MTMDGAVPGMNAFHEPESRRFLHPHLKAESADKLGAHSISAIIADPEGGIWIGTIDSGLIHFDKRTGGFVHYRHDPEGPNSLSSDAVSAPAAAGSTRSIRPPDASPATEKLGLDADYPYAANRTTGFSKNGILVLASDGIPEARNTDGEMFGKERLRELIRSSAHESAKNIAGRIFDAVGAFSKGTMPEDDRALVVIKHS